jgi:hypothetical protein
VLGGAVILGGIWLVNRTPRTNEKFHRGAAERN